MIRRSNCPGHGLEVMCDKVQATALEDDEVVCSSIPISIPEGQGPRLAGSTLGRRFGPGVPLPDFLVPSSRRSRATSNLITQITPHPRKKEPEVW